MSNKFRSTVILPIPGLPSGLPSGLPGVLDAMKVNLETGMGERAKPTGVDWDRWVRVRDLTDADFLSRIGMATAVEESAAGGDKTPPGPPTEFIVTPQIWANFLSWVNPTDDDFAYVEVWGATIDDLDQAEILANVSFPSASWSHSLPDVTADWYYWVRAVDFYGNKSEFVGDGEGAGVPAPGKESVGIVIDEIMTVLHGYRPAYALYDPAETYYYGDRASFALSPPDGDGIDRMYKCIVGGGGSITGQAPMIYDDESESYVLNIAYWVRSGILIEGDVDGIPTVGVDGSLVVDKTILARSIQTDTLSAISADLGTVTAGQIVVGDTINKLWFNDSNDGGLAVGGLVKSAAPFQVSPDGILSIRGAIVISPSGTSFPVPAYRGPFDPGVTYYKGDMATYDGSAWIYIYNTPGYGHIPGVSARWEIHAQAGEAPDAAKTLHLTASGQAFKYDKDGAADPASQTITFIAVGQNLTGATWQFTTTPNVKAQNTTSDTFTLTNTNMGSNASVRVTVTRDGLSDFITVYRVQDGSDSVVSFLTNEAHTVPAATDGSLPDLSGASTFTVIKKGADNVTADWTFSNTNRADTAGAAGKIVSGCLADITTSGEDKGKITVTAMTADVATVTVIATRTGSANMVKVFTLTKSRAGAAGAIGPVGPIGTAAQTIRVYAASQVFHVDEVGAGSPAYIDVLADLQNISGTVSWSASPAVTLSTITGGRRLTFANMGANEQVRITATIAGLSDAITIVKVADGAGWSLFLTNENHTYAADDVGAITGSWSDGYTQVRGYRGRTQLVCGSTSTSPPTVDGQYRVTARTVISGTMTTTVGLVGNQYEVRPTAMSTDYAVVQLTINARWGGVNTEFIKLVTYSKSRRGAVGDTGQQGIQGIQGIQGLQGLQGLQGIQGLIGAAGVNARAVNLTAGMLGFVYDKNGATPTPASTEITAVALNAEGTIYYRFWKNDVSVQHSTSNTYTYTPQPAYEDMPDIIEVEIREGSTGNPVLARDQITMLGMRQGSDAVYSILSNESHTVPADADGAVTSYAGSGSTLQLYDGAAAMIFHTTLASGRFTVGTPTVSPVLSPAAIVVNSRSGSGSITCVIPDHSAMRDDTDVVTITYPITARKFDGTTVTFDVVQTITKSKQGATGLGKAVAELLIFRRGTTAPATPTGGSFNFTTQSLTPPTNWSASIPSGTGQVYISTAVAAILGNEGVDSSLTWSSPVQAFADGIDGQAVDIVFRRSATQPATPAASSGVPAGWYTDVNSVPAGADPIWSSVGTRANPTANWVWQTPVRIEAEDGTNAAYVVVTGEQAFKYLTGQTVPVNTTITMTAHFFGGLSGYIWQYWSGTSWMYMTSAPSDQATYTLAHNHGEWGGRNALRVRCLASSDLTKFDEITIVKLYDGAAGYTVTLTNETHAIACNSDGVPASGEIGSSGRAISDIRVFKGVTQLTPVGAATTPAAGQFRYNLGTVSGGTAARWDNDTFYLNTISADSGRIPLTVYCEGTTIAITKEFTFVKAKAGATGATGLTGPTGDPGFKTFHGPVSMQTTIQQTANVGDEWYITDQGWVARYLGSGQWVNIASVNADGLINMPKTPTSTPGFYNNGEYMGYHDGTNNSNPGGAPGWKVFIRNNGRFFFGGDNDNYLQWTGTVFTLSTNKVGGLQIKSGGSLVIQDGGGITVSDGGDIIMSCHASNPSEIIFRYGTTTQSILSSNASGNVYWRPNVANGKHFCVGLEFGESPGLLPTRKRFETIQMSAYSNTIIEANDACIYMGASQVSIFERGDQNGLCDLWVTGDTTFGNGISRVHDFNGYIRLAERSAKSAEAGYAILYAYENGTATELRASDSNGNNILLTPHRFDLFTPSPEYEAPWTYHCENPFIGKVVNADMFGTLRAVEALWEQVFGEKKQLIYLSDIEKVDWDADQLRQKSERDAKEAAQWAAHYERGETYTPKSFNAKPVPAWIAARLGHEKQQKEKKNGPAE